MSITFVAVGTASTNSTAGVTNSPGIPAGLTNAADEMYMAVAVSGDKTGTLNTPAGWTKLGASANGTSITLVVYRKLFATGDSAPSVTWTTNNKNTGRIAGYAGCDTSTPEDVAITFATGSGTAAASPSATALTRGAMRLHIVAYATNGTSTPDFRTVERADQATSTSSAAHLDLNDEQGMAEGATSTRTSTGSATGAWVAATIWIKPAVADTFGLLQSAKAITTSVGSSLAATFPAACTNGSTILAGVVTNNGSANTVSSVDTAAGANAFARDVVASGSSQEGSLWRIANTLTTAATVTAHVSGSDDIGVLALEWLGLDGAAPDASGSGASTGGTMSATTSTSTTSGSRLAVAYASPFTTTTSYGFTSGYVPRDTIDLVTTHQGQAGESRAFSGGSTETATITVSSADAWVMVVAAYKAVTTDPFPLLPGRFISPLYRM